MKGKITMWIIAGLYILCIIISIIIYFIGCNIIGKYENNKSGLEYSKAIKLFKVSLGILIIGFSLLGLGLIIRII